MSYKFENIGVMAVFIMHDKEELKEIFENAENNLTKIYKFYKGEKLKETYLTCPTPKEDMDNVFENFIRALQNGSNIGPSAIQFENEEKKNRENIIKVCNGDDNDKILKLEKFEYTNADDLYKKFARKGLCQEENYKKNSSWYRFAQGIVAGAQKLKNEQNYNNFKKKFAINEPDKQKKAIKDFCQDIPNMGFELTCDFLKEFGFFQYGKPDVHIRNIFYNLGLIKNINDDNTAFDKICEIAKTTGKTPYYVDKVLWLLASGNFYKHIIVEKNKYKTAVLSRREMLTALTAPENKVSEGIYFKIKD